MARRVCRAWVWWRGSRRMAPRAGGGLGLPTPVRRAPARPPARSRSPGPPHCTAAHASWRTRTAPGTADSPPAAPAARASAPGRAPRAAAGPSAPHRLPSRAASPANSSSAAAPRPSTAVPSRTPCAAGTRTPAAAAIRSTACATTSPRAPPRRTGRPPESTPGSGLAGLSDHGHRGVDGCRGAHGCRGVWVVVLMGTPRAPHPHRDPRTTHPAQAPPGRERPAPRHPG